MALFTQQHAAGGKAASAVKTALLRELRPGMALQEKWSAVMAVADPPQKK